ncbi:hypothetical protein HYZ99_00660 [Candidatus Peregrinibacteria bacterium]|nr:hypothetical protein [Candidatus Peregrinibacteria bacterium]
MKIRTLAPWGYIALLMVVTGISLFSSTPRPLDDHFFYQRFVEALARGDLDLSIPGFHGADLFAVPLYWMTQSPIAQIYAQMVLACLIPLAGFLAGRALFKSVAAGILLSSILAMMPFISFVSLRGWTGPGYFVLMLLTLWLGSRGSLWTVLTFGLAILTKPFAIGLLPLLLVIAPQKQSLWIRYRHLLGAAVLVAFYLGIQYVQAGRIFVGAHSETTVTGIWQDPYRILLNLAHAVQILFSVHNYYYPDPALTGPGNLMHTSPVLIFLGLFWLFSPTGKGLRTEDLGKKSLSPQSYFLSPRGAILIGALLVFILNALLDHMDFFLVPAVVDACFIIFCLVSLPRLRSMWQHTIFAHR